MTRIYICIYVYRYRRGDERGRPDDVIARVSLFPLFVFVRSSLALYDFLLSYAPSLNTTSRLYIY